LSIKRETSCRPQFNAPRREISAMCGQTMPSFQGSPQRVVRFSSLARLPSIYGEERGGKGGDGREGMEGREGGRRKKNVLKN